jgi:hypothetical protein
MSAGTTYSFNEFFATRIEARRKMRLCDRPKATRALPLSAVLMDPRAVARAMRSVATSTSGVRGE